MAKQMHGVDRVEWCDAKQVHAIVAALVVDANGTKMNDQKKIDIRCPVCGQPLISVEGGIRVGGQICLRCHSRKCGGRMRYLNAQLIEKIIDINIISGIVSDKI